MVIRHPTISRNFILLPAAVTAFAALFYAIFTIFALATYEWNPLWFVWVGERYAELDPAGRLGYDGQFTYYLAQEGADALPHIDNPPYRLQRILFPVIARLLSLGAPALVPWAMIAVNFAAIVVSTRLLARLLLESDLSPWYALTYAMFVGTFMAYSRALAEPLAICLAVIGVLSWSQERNKTAVLALSLASLAKETALIFVVGIMLAELARKEIRSALLAASSLLPLLVWQIYLFLELDALPLFSHEAALQLVPLGGIIPHLTPEPGRLSAFAFVAIPALLLSGTSAVFLVRQRGREPAAWWLLLSGVLLILLPIEVYDHIMHAGRNALSLVVAALFFMPLVVKPLRLMLFGYWVAPTLIWLIPVLSWAPWLSEI